MEEIRMLLTTIKQAPVILLEGIMFHDADETGHYTLTTPGIAVTSEDTKSSETKRYIVLDYNCDDMAQTLLHESLHHTYPKLQEETIEHLTSLYWEHGLMRRTAQDRMVKVLSGYDL